MATSSTNVCESSDIVHEYPCKPCADDGKNIESDNFCAECQTFFCHQCVQFHNKCYRTHTIFNKSGVKSGKIQYEQQQDWLACERHAGYYIQMYCGEHETVCCAVCIAVDHRLCKSADFIPKLATEILNGRDRKDVKNSLEGIQKQLRVLKARKLEHIENFGKEKDENLKEIVKMKEEIFARVNEMEQKSVKQVQEKHDGIIGVIKTDIECIDVQLNAIEINIEKIDTFRGDNEAKLFVVLNKAHEVEVGSCSFIDKNGYVKYGKLEFEINPNIFSFLSKVDAFGSVKGDSVLATSNILATRTQLSEASLVKTVSVKGRDSCMLDNGQVVIVSDGLKRLDESYKLLDAFDMLFMHPIHLCKVGPTEVAILYGNNEIAFVNAGKSLVLTRSFRISDEKDIYLVESEKMISRIDVSGISFANGKLLVCVTLRYGIKHTKHLYKFGVSIYDLKGSHIKTCIFLADSDYDIEINHATYSSYDSCIYIATKTNGVIVFRMTNGTIKKLKEITHERLPNAHYVCQGNNGQFFVCGKDSQNVFLLDSQNNTMEEILGSIDGIIQPQSVMYMKQQNCLLVTSMSPEIKVYQLK